MRLLLSDWQVSKTEELHSYLTRCNFFDRRNIPPIEGFVSPVELWFKSSVRDHEGEVLPLLNSLGSSSTYEANAHLFD